MKKLICLLIVMLLLMATGCAQEEENYRLTVADDDLSLAQGLSDDWTHILLVGSDSREDEANQGRGDAIIVCSIHKASGKIRLTSLARDMWVEIAGQGFHDKINTAFRYGGPNLMMKTVNETLALNITDYVSINFYGLCDMVDAIGGIEVTLSQAERSVVNSTTQWKYGEVRGERLPGGSGDQTVKLCGAQALAYARIRKLDNDLGRNRRQRNVLMAVFNKASQLSLSELLSLGKTCLEYMTTNISFVDLMSLGMTVLKGGMNDISQLSLPSAGNFYYISPNGKSALKFDLEQVQNEMHTFIYGSESM